MSPRLRLSILDAMQKSTGLTSGQAMRETIALAQYAEELGYHRYWIVEHHATPFEANPAPEVFAMALAGATRSIRVGVGGVLLNHYSPYKAAECMRTLGVMFPGRIDAGFGRARTGTLADTALRRLRGCEVPDDQEEQIREVIGWLSHQLDADSPFRAIRIMPDEPAGPTPWILAASEESALRAARYGIPLAFSAFIAPGIAAPAVAAYRRAFVASRYAAGVSEPALITAVRVIVAETKEEAEYLAMPVRAVFKLRREQNILLETWPTPEEAIALLGGMVPAEEADWPAYLVGTPRQVRSTIERMSAQTGVTEFMLQEFLPTLSLRKRQYHLIAREML
ncbi:MULTISPECIES: MsnO8 family LLM class oxidoreductase [unclassified Chelatococcus]|uniref:MsnO8 family LLM class oxidoreductase n=1 Tax=unclassified Chelatococcus TaxID=2638111 RepID=UPI001BCD49AF|nr:MULTISPECIES: MsnO8 family LLM class oxidoreductase [unclassified Chelatococcus]CAH1659771.1 Luciferase family oxidoreductase group 1 [Hyphomicrobiales bacterium]MBS7740986.1 MsnO8 family LLM class oxidoreductase [Chelatococcus sp. HY11]MBX3545172.1 MsnO8 family LLM class oxidoreductase [Chelatococcus sp.]MCO5077805.1 MsnO8 family LLM class oxidoreductase [Chelatococcus sp.]CAH1683704.1 Luciferase family oxidoreductase group 1 [Hyphomicrobiales bacterium]